MKVTFLGHAMLLVEGGDMRCLFDPIFSEAFEDGAVRFSPGRCFGPAAFPHVDAVVISHRHPDHLDISSLARFDRDTALYIPDDSLIRDITTSLGFRNITTVCNGRAENIRDLVLIPTPSLNRDLLEHGFILSDGSGLIWNQVDSECDALTIANILRSFGPIDVHISNFSVHNFGFFEHRSIAFPLEDYANRLAVTLAVDAKVVVPGASGFRFHGAHEWINSFYFPVSPHRFEQDLARLAPSMKVEKNNPGDVLEIASGNIKMRPQAAPFIRRAADATEDATRFCPLAGIPELEDPNPDDCAVGDMRADIAAYLSRLRSNLDERSFRSTRLEEVYEAGNCYRLEIVYPDGSSENQIVTPPGISVSSSEACLHHKIAASALLGYVSFRKSGFYVRAYERRHSSAWSARLVDGELRAQAIPFFSLVEEHLRQVKV